MPLRIRPSPRPLQHGRSGGLPMTPTTRRAWQRPGMSLLASGRLGYTPGAPGLEGEDPPSGLLGGPWGSPWDPQGVQDRRRSRSHPPGTPQGNLGGTSNKANPNYHAAGVSQCGTAMHLLPPNCVLCSLGVQNAVLGHGAVGIEADTSPHWCWRCGPLHLQNVLRCALATQQCIPLCHTSHSRPREGNSTPAIPRAGVPAPVARIWARPGLEWSPGS